MEFSNDEWNCGTATNRRASAINDEEELNRKTRECVGTYFIVICE